MPVSDFFPLMPHTVNIAPYASRDSFGKPSYGADVAHRARVVYKNIHIRASDGSEKVARGVVYLGSAVVVSPEDRVTLPDTTTPPVLACNNYSDDVGAHHTQIYFG